jgi:hypothetical protein
MGVYDSYIRAIDKGSQKLKMDVAIHIYIYTYIYIYIYIYIGCVCVCVCVSIYIYYPRIVVTTPLLGAGSSYYECLLGVNSTTLLARKSSQG